jgi:hypothetical protein
MPSKKTDVNTTIAVVLTKLENIEQDISSINKKLENNYVTKDRFEPIKSVVYGLVSLILVAVTGAIISLVIK